MFLHVSVILLTGGGACLEGGGACLGGSVPALGGCLPGGVPAGGVPACGGVPAGGCLPGGVPAGGDLTRPPPRIQSTLGRYASYWNAFLFFKAMDNVIWIQKKSVEGQSQTIAVQRKNVHNVQNTNWNITRMHSSRMRTIRSLTVSCSIWLGGSSHPPRCRPPISESRPPARR